MRSTEPSCGRHDLDRQPGTIGSEAPGWQVIESHAVLQVPDGVLYLGVATVVGLQFQDIPQTVGDEGVIAVVVEEGQLGSRSGPHPAEDEPHRHSIKLALRGFATGRNNLL